jgi:hypothetical protein
LELVRRVRIAVFVEHGLKSTQLLADGVATWQEGLTKSLCGWDVFLATEQLGRERPSERIFRPHLRRGGTGTARKHTLARSDRGIDGAERHIERFQIEESGGEVRGDESVAQAEVDVIAKMRDQLRAPQGRIDAAQHLAHECVLKIWIHVSIPNLKIIASRHSERIIRIQSMPMIQLPPALPKRKGVWVVHRWNVSSYLLDIPPLRVQCFSAREKGANGNRGGMLAFLAF